MAPADEPSNSRHDADHDNDDTPREPASERTPLLPRDEVPRSDQSQPHREHSAHDALESLHQPGKPGSRRRWPSLAALLGLCVGVILIIVFAFISPSIVEQYARQAIKFEPQSLSIDAFTETGVRARIQGEFVLDGDRVKQKPVRDLGRFYTWIAREAESRPSDVEVSLPEYGNVLLGIARVPSIKVDLRSGHPTPIDFLADLEPGDVDGIKNIADDWIKGRLGRLRVLAKASVPVRSGIIRLGAQTIQHELIVSEDDVPAIPSYDIKRLLFRDLDHGMAVDATAVVQNDYPVQFNVPPIAFTLMVDNCKKSDPFIPIADGRSEEIQVTPHAIVQVDATGVVQQLPGAFLRDCPGTEESPMDVFLTRYIAGEENTVYVRGSNHSADGTPQWIGDMLADFTVPLPLPGRTIGHLIKNFTLVDSKFDLPNPWADPNSPEGNPRITAKVRALVSVPKEMNFNLAVSSVRADADVFYKGEKFGQLDLHKWQHANSTRLSDNRLLMVESFVDNAPLYITDEQVFTKVIEKLLFGGNGVTMHIKAEVDIKVATALGDLTVRRIPAEGEVPIQPISSGRPGFGKPGDIDSVFKPKISDLQIIDTTASSLTISALVNMTNPTPYSANVPFVDIHLVKNGSILGHVTVRDTEVVPGSNNVFHVTAVYDPLTMGGTTAARIGRDFVSQYISGYNTSLTLQTHAGTIPNQPALGEAFSRFKIVVPTPHLGEPRKPSPGDGDDDDVDEGPHFIQDAIMHLFSSTATFTLLSPLKRTALTITKVNATAVYNDTYGDLSEVGHIYYDLPFDVPPMDHDGNGVTTPRLPVDWSLGSVGYDAVRNALGGRLKVGAFAHVGVKIGFWQDELWFRGQGIGAKIRL